MLWQDLREEQFEEAIEKSKGVCIIPVGCLEKHGQHSPVGTDYYIALSIAERAAEMEDVVIFPTGPWLGDVGGSHANKNPELTRKRGFIGLNIKTMIWALEELCDEIARNGFTKIALFNVHGGNLAMFDTLMKTQAKKKKKYATYNVRACRADDYTNQPEPFVELVTKNREEYPMITDEDIEVMKGWIKTGYQGGHANFLENVQVMGDHPELIEPERYEQECGINNHRCDYLSELGINVNGGWSARYPNSYSGAAPHGSSQTIGDAMLYNHAKHCAEVLRRIKNDDLALGAVSEL